MQPSLDAEALADRICNCCRMLCCPVLPRTPSGEPPEELELCGDHLDYLLEQSLLHGAREERGGFFGRGKMFDALSLFIESSPAVSMTEYKEYTDFAALARELAKTSPGRVRLFVRMLFNRGFYVTFIRSMHASSEKYYLPSAFLRDSSAVEHVSMAIDIMRGHVRLDFMVKDNRVDAKEYWSERGRDVTQFDPATEYAQQTILPLFPDDSPDLLAAEAVLDAHLRSSRLRAHRSASEASEGLLRGRSVCTIASLSAASSDAAGLLLWALDNKNDSRNNLRPLALAASSVAASLCAQRLRRRLEGLCGAASASSSLIAAVGSKRRLSALSEASTVAAGLLRGACCARVPRASAEAAGLLRCRAQRVLYKAVAGASAGCAATLRGARCPVVRELVPAAVAAQALLAGAVGRADYVGFVPRGVERAQACFRARGVASAHRGRVGAAEACQALVRLTRTAPRPADIAGLAAASRLAQGLVCAAGIHARFREVVGASEAFQGVAVAASEGVAFLLYVIVAVWAQGAVRTSLAGSRNARMAATTREAQGLFRTAFQQNCRFRPALALVRYTQGVIADRKLEAIRAAEHAKRVASAAATASASPLMMRGGDGSGGQAQKKSDTFVSIDSFKVDLSKHNFASTIPTKRPVWVPDSFSNTCSICAKNFSFGNRRHHCRNCGNLVCTQCTIFMPLVHLGYEKPVRVCKPCRDFLLSAK